MKVTVKRWHAVASWTWGVGEECCGICRNAFDACCPDCTQPGDSCVPAFGRCNHALHMHCIEKWLESRAQEAKNCPLCRQEWEYR